MTDGTIKIGIILDIVLALILVVIVLIGARKGFIKMIRGLISITLLVVISLFAVTPVTNLLCEKVNWDEKLADALSSPLQSLVKFDEPNMILTYLSEYDATVDEKGNEVAGLVYLTESGDYRNFNDLLDKATFMQQFALKNLIKSQAESYLKPVVSDDDDDSTSSSGRKTLYLISSLSSSVSIYLMLAMVGTALYIISYILLRILFSFFQKAANKLYLMHFINKTLGAVMGAAIGAVVIYLLITLMLLLQNVTFMEPVNLAVESSYVTKYLFRFDGLYLFVKDFSIMDLINSMINGILKK